MGADVRTRMQFGIFLGPLHKPSGNPTWDLERDLRMIERLDELGFDEAFIGEHHSSGWEIIGSPEVFIAAAAERTKHIKLATGVVSLPYHHPLMVAERLVLLDHLTRGRVILGVGPGALPSDASMMGLEYASLRERMEESLEAILALLQDEGTIDRKTDWFELRRAQLQMLPYTRPRPEVAVTAVASPSGPRLAGRLGLPMIALAAGSPAGQKVLAEHWRIYEEQLALHGHQAPDRGDWRLVSPIHVAPTRAKAEEQVSYAIEDAGAYFFRDSSVLTSVLNEAGLPPDASKLDVFRASAMGCIGSVEDVIEHIEHLQELSGGFGKFLIMMQDWADHDDTLKSLEVFAREVMPHFQDSNRRRLENWEVFHGSEEDFQRDLSAASARAREQYEKSRRSGD
ncbi:LLM class flavin-dependent oxidoreductase [Streptomyces spiralis]|uniref:LLM class flavin-dependent oxidoreductase n=1 Tax=Streptomyces spiralis TaxID=66376 RepID=UPI0033C78734